MKKTTLILYGISLMGSTLGNVAATIQSNSPGTYGLLSFSLIIFSIFLIHYGSTKGIHE